MDWTSHSNFENPHSRPFLCSVLWPFRSFFTSLFWCSVSGCCSTELFQASRELIFREPRAHMGGASGPEKKMALKTSGFWPSPGSRRTSSVILRTWQVSLYFTVLSRSPSFLRLGRTPPGRQGPIFEGDFTITGLSRSGRASFFAPVAQSSLSFVWVRGWSPWPRVPKVCGVASRDVLLGNFSPDASSTQGARRGTRASCDSTVSDGSHCAGPSRPGPDASVVCDPFCLLSFCPLTRGCIHGSPTGRPGSEILFLLSSGWFTARRMLAFTLGF